MTQNNNTFIPDVNELSKIEPNEAPHISVSAQYIKDLSFENPNSPHSLGNIGPSPSIDLSLDLRVQKMEENSLFEVQLMINAKTENEDKTLFIVDLVYAGVFQILNVPEEQMEVVLAVHCPSIIFPFARKIVADVTQDGGYQPLMIDPIDFGMLYAKKLNDNLGN
jgi:preprotein translocase subunit SecB